MIEVAQDPKDFVQDRPWAAETAAAAACRHGCVHLSNSHMLEFQTSVTALRRGPLANDYIVRALPSLVSESS